MDRRTFVKSSAIALAGAPLLGGTAAPLAAQSCGARKLYLFFHGLVAHVWWPGHVQILIPKLTDNSSWHKYQFRCGAATESMKKGTYDSVAEGFAGSKHPFDGAFDMNNLVKPYSIPTGQNARSEILLPYPCDVSTYRDATITDPMKDFFCLVAGPRNMRLVPVYTYTIPDDVPDGLEPPFRFAKGTTGNVKVHMIAEPDKAEHLTKEHAQHAWGRTASLFKTFELNYCDPDVEVQPSGFSNNPEFTDDDFRSLAEKQMMKTVSKPTATEHAHSSNPRLCGSLFVNNREMVAAQTQRQKRSR